MVEKTLAQAKRYNNPCAMLPEDEQDCLLSRADENLYKAKHQGRNRVCGETVCM